MGDRDLALILERIRHTAAEVGGISDSQLLDRFVARQDEAAFELLLWRHARLVFGVCQRVLHNSHDAEDAFQAVVLILARQAGRIDKRAAVASWLYKVAYRVALTLRSNRSRTTARERPLGATEDVAAPPGIAAPAERAEIQQVLDQEVNRLPERFRAPVILCYLEGKTVDEAALQIGCPRGTVASRLARARERLRVRLARRGLALAAGLVALQQAAAAPRPLALMSTLLPAIFRSTTGATADAGLSRNAVALTHEVIKAMFWHKVKTSVAVVCALAGILAAGGGLAVHLRANSDAKQVAAAEPSKAEAQKQEPVKERPADAIAAAKTIKASQPLRREFTPHEDYLGRLEALRTVEVRASVRGRLEKIEFKPGAEIKKGDVLFEIDPAVYRLSLDKARAELDVAEAQKKFSEAELTRALRLKEKGSIGQQEYDQIVASQAIAEAKSRVAQAEVDRAELNLQATKVKAPVDGVIGQPRVDLGNHVTEDGGRSLLLATILSLDPIRLGFDMDQASFLRYRRLMREHEVKGPGSAVSMELLDEKDFSRPGTLESFDVRIDPETGTVRVHGTFPNRDRLLLPGLSARVRIAFGRPRQVLEVPESAIQRGPRNAFVYVVGERDLIEKRAVKLGPRDDGMHVIEEGLHEGDWVVGNIDELANTGGRITFERTTKKLKSP